MQLAEALVPDITTAPVVRKKRAPKHDFKDGKGRVFAHKHDNGGGWVADTAYVAPGVKVSRSAQVYDFAKVYDACKITHNAQVCGNAHLYNCVTVRDSAIVRGYARVYNNARLCGSTEVRDSALITGDAEFNNRVRVYNHARIHGGEFNGPRYFATLAVADNCYLDGVVAHDDVGIGGSALVKNSTLRGVRVHSDALIMYSDIHTVREPQEASVYIVADYLKTRYSHLPQYDAEVLARTVVEAPIVWVTGTVWHSSIYSRFLHLDGLLAQCHMRFCPPTQSDADEAQQQLNRLNNGLPNVLTTALTRWNHSTIGSKQELEAAIDRALRGPTSNAVAVMSRNTEMPNLQQVRQRRLLRVEDSDS